MKQAWISGRFLFGGIAILGPFVSLGSDRPDSSIRLNQDTEDAGASNTSQDDEKIGKAEDLVKDWEKPKFVLFISGRQHGYIEPCGCITLARQKGGMMRRHAVQKMLEDRGWDVVGIDAGNQVQRFGQQPLIKLRKTYDALCGVMNYDVIGLGPDDLKLPAINLAQTIANVVDGDSPFTCANVDMMGMTEDHIILERGGKRIGVTMILGDEHLDQVKQQNVTTQSVADGLQKVIPKLADCDMKVLIAFTEVDTCRELAKQFPNFDVLVTAGGAGDPTLRPELIKADNNHVTSMIQVGVKGMYVGLIGYYEDDGKPRIDYERVELDHRYKDSEAIKAIFKSYQEELKALWEKGLLKDIAERDHPTGLEFVGSPLCADCHDEEYAIWEDGVDGKGGPHEKATRDLEENPNDDRVWVQRHFDPECISCHATGWNAQNFYPYKTGLMKLDDEDLLGNGCENCHGPGSAHVEIEDLAAKGQQVNPEERIQRAREMYLSVSEARATACKECHDSDNSPDFLEPGGFDKYWPKVKHGRPAIEKIQSLFASIGKGARPMADLALVQDWLPDLAVQNPSQVALVEKTLNSLRSSPKNAAAIIKAALDKIEVE
jgi:hypothetical protein